MNDPQGPTELPLGSRRPEGRGKEGQDHREGQGHHRGEGAGHVESSSASQGRE